MRPEPQVGGGMGERCAFYFFWLSLLFSLNLVVNPLRLEIWMSLSDIHFQKGPIPNLELPDYSSAWKRELQYCGVHRT